MGFCCNDRVFMCDTREYGTVTRTRVLGLKKSGSYAVVTDSGRTFMYTGSPTKHIVCSKTLCNEFGEKYSLPLDLKTISESILHEEGVSPKKRYDLYLKFAKISDEEHGVYRDAYTLVSSSKEKTRDFVMDVLNKLS